MHHILHRGSFVSKKKTWIKTRHKVITCLLRPVFGIFVRLKYGIKIEKFKDQGKRPYLILMNHQTAYDQFFVGLTFNRPVYYLASEDIFSMGWLSRLIQWLVEPIPIKKQTTDIQAVKNCIRVAREGGTICLAPEGNRTYHGRTLYMKDSISPLVRKLGLPIALFRIEGGYGVHPRWSDVVRRGGMRSCVSRVIEPEEYVNMTNAELFEQIELGLTVHEDCVITQYRHKKNAEFLERAVYTCPWCGFAPFESHNDVIHCTKCKRKIRHLPSKELEGIDCEFPHRFVAQWYDWQNDFVNQTDLLSMTEEPVFEDQAQLSLVHVNQYKELVKKDVKVCLYGDRITVDERVFSFAQVGAVVVLGKNKLNIYDGDELLQLKGSKRFNALKYVNFYHRYKNLNGGDRNDEFLGL